MPGITGLAQIELPPDTDPQSVHRKTALDLHYIQSASVSQDMRIVCCTLLKVIGLRPVRPARSSPPCPFPQPVEERQRQAPNPHEKVLATRST